MKTRGKIRIILLTNSNDFVQDKWMKQFVFVTWCNVCEKFLPTNTLPDEGLGPALKKYSPHLGSGSFGRTL